MLPFFYWTIWHPMLFYTTPFTLGCSLNNTELRGIVEAGDIVIGGVLHIHGDKIYPKISFTEKPAPVVCKMCYRGVPLTAVVGHSTSTYTIMMAHILGLYRYPQISHLSTSSLLSDRTQFPSFFRTVPSDAFQSKGLAQLILHFGWTWVGLVAVDNDYGQRGIQVISREILKAGACVSFTENIRINQPDRNAPHIARVIKESTANAVIIFSTDFDLTFILDEMLRQKVTGKIWLASEAWATSPIVSVDKYSGLLSGTIGFALPRGTIPGFREFLNSINLSMSTGGEWVKIFWEEAFSCKFPDQNNITGSSVTSTKQCTGAENLETIQNLYNDVSSLRITYSVYTAVRVVAKALQDLIDCRDGEGPFSHGRCSDIWNFRPWQLLHYVKKVRMRTSSGRELYFNENGDPPAVYDIVNWQLSLEGGIKQVKVGSYDTGAAIGQVFTINASVVHWASGGREIPLSVCSNSCPPGFRKAALRGEPVCCFHCVLCPQGEISNQTDSIHCFKCPWDMWPNQIRDRCLPKSIEFLSYEEPLGVILAATSVSSSLVPVIILGLFIHYKNTPIVRANNYTLSCLLLWSLSLCFLCSLAFIGYPHPEKCLMRQVAFGMVFALCVSCILAKTIMVVIAFKATKPGSNLNKWTSPQVSYLVVIFCILIQTFLCIFWLSFSPPFLEHNTQTQSAFIIVECNEGSPIVFWCMLGYLGLLATISFIVAFLARQLPDSFNEATLITFSMLAFLSVWVSFILASLSARGKYTAAMEVFAILSSSWSLVVCMFVPKCFIILFKPNMNSRELLMGKDKSRTHKVK
ncbi:extracellular calcium-sensing receptor-like isoform X2 [Ascaphus truei]|uniref:extracellular calcium-sensing receptor-like isoform X2 n=1 Tax=Ascaphus truei TaxID=8439 RepID=UPI003F590D49